MTFLYLLVPALLICVSSVGYGFVALTLAGRRLSEQPFAFRMTVAYFLGQSLLVIVFLALAMRGAFIPAVVISLVALGAVFGCASLWFERHAIKSASSVGFLSWKRAPLAWRILSLLAFCLFAYGLTSMGRTLEVDAAAFYLAAAKLLAFTGRISPVPGYESFSWVVMTGEFLYATMTLLGAPGTGSRFFEYINFLPLLSSVYWLARGCKLSGRAAFVACTMVLTSSFMVGLWGGGKTETFAVGPAMLGAWFAVAAWQSQHRIFHIVMSGLFCGFAIAAKTTYIVVLPPSMLLTIFWPQLLAMIADVRARNGMKGLRGASSMVPGSVLFLACLALGLMPLLIKNVIVLGTVLGSASHLASGSWFSKATIIQIVVSYPFALTYGRYWAQLGTFSPLVLAFIPLLALMPRRKRRLLSPMAALTISALIAMVIWVALLPSIFMPRYVMATLALFAIPAAAGAASLSRRGGILAGVIVVAVATVIVFLPRQADSRLAVFFPERAWTYYKTGNELAIFTSDPYASTTASINKVAKPGERVLLLIYPRVWLRPDLLATTGSMAEVDDATSKLAKSPIAFWAFLKDKNFTNIILDTVQMPKLTEALKVKPADLQICEVMNYAGAMAYRIGENCAACPAGPRTELTPPFASLGLASFGYIKDIPAFETIADYPDAPNSPIAVCEGETKLWPAHSLHEAIRTEGHGRYSHWAKQLYFSASDSTDPNTNGRKYTIVIPQ